MKKLLILVSPPNWTFFNLEGRLILTPYTNTWDFFSPTAVIKFDWPKLELNTFQALKCQIEWQILEISPKRSTGGRDANAIGNDDFSFSVTMRRWKKYFFSTSKCLSESSGTYILFSHDFSFLLTYDFPGKHLFIQLVVCWYWRWKMDCWN